MGIRVILSDLHFGVPECSLNIKPVSEGLRNFLRKYSPIEEIIFAGDILDINISSFTRAIEGSRSPGFSPEQIGFRRWLSYIFENNKLNVGRIVYIPGNHDYKIWNIIATERVFVQPYSRGEIPKNLPLMNGTFEDSFLKGVAPAEVRDNFVVIYPDYEFDLAGRYVLVTHGHYLDWTQNLSTMDLQGYIDAEGEGMTEQAVRKFFIATAQYQALANIASYKVWSRKSAIFLARIYTIITLPRKFIRNFGKIFDSGLRNKVINSRMLISIETYLHYFSKIAPDVFIFGHTHVAGRSYIDPASGGPMGKAIEVWNDGGFIINRKSNRAGTFIIADDSQHIENQIKLYKIDLAGNIREHNP